MCLDPDRDPVLVVARGVFDMSPVGGPRRREHATHLSNGRTYTRYNRIVVGMLCIDVVVRFKWPIEKEERVELRASSFEAA